MKVNGLELAEKEVDKVKSNVVGRWGMMKIKWTDRKKWCRDEKQISKWNIVVKALKFKEGQKCLVCWPIGEIPAKTPDFLLHYCGKSNIFRIHRTMKAIR